MIVENKQFYKLELIKEKFLKFFYQQTADGVQELIVQVKNWKYRVTSALSEGINNIIKSLKGRSFGFRNMNYFRLKVMQVCGYLNSD